MLKTNILKRSKENISNLIINKRSKENKNNSIINKSRLVNLEII